MINQLVQEHFDFLEGENLFMAFDTIMKQQSKFKSAESRQQVEKLYFQLVELSDNNDMFSEQQTAMLDLYYIPVYIQTNLYTDDTFKFNEVIKEINQILPTIPNFEATFDQQITTFNQQSKIPTLVEPNDDNMFYKTSSY